MNHQSSPALHVDNSVRLEGAPTLTGSTSGIISQNFKNNGPSRSRTGFLKPMVFSLLVCSGLWSCSKATTEEESVFDSRDFVTLDISENMLTPHRKFYISGVVANGDTIMALGSDGLPEPRNMSIGIYNRDNNICTWSGDGLEPGQASTGIYYSKAGEVPLEYHLELNFGAYTNHQSLKLSEGMTLLCDTQGDPSLSGDKFSLDLE